MHKDLVVDGVFYPSVTEVLGSVKRPWLEKWRAKWGKRADQKMRAAARIGTAFHKSVEDGLTFDVRVDNMFNVFSRWSAEVGLRIHSSEQHVTNTEYGYHGTFDAIGALGKSKTLYIFDWKTSAGIYPEMGLQLTAYARAYEEMTGTKIKTGIIVQVSKDKPYHKLRVKRFKLIDGRYKEFLELLARYKESDEFAQRSYEAIRTWRLSNSIKAAQ